MNEPIHPSEFIIEEMETRGWGRAELARRMIRDDRDSLGPTMLALDLYLDAAPAVLLGEDGFSQLAHAFGTESGVWRNLQRAWSESPPPTREGQER